MHRFITLVGLCGLLVVASSSSAQDKLKKIRFTYPTESIAVLPLFAAVKWKTFEDNDLQVEIIQARSQVANAALASGEIGYFAGVGPASVSATLRGLQSRAVWFASDEIIYLLLARPEFTTVRDLRNKKIGITGLGGTAHVALQIALEAVRVKIPRTFFTCRSPRRNCSRLWKAASSMRRCSVRRTIFTQRKRAFAKC